MDYSNNMKQYINNISDRLAGFVLQVEQEGKNNLHDTKVLAENFYAEYLNVLYGWDLKNANITRSNEPGIDLRYDAGDIIVQVSSDDSYKKIQESLEKIESSNHPSGRFCFVAIKATAQKHTKAFTIPVGVSFDPASDIFDNAKLIGESSHFGIDKLKALSELMDKYFSSGEKTTKGNYLTTPPAFADTSSVIFRDVELGEIEEKLKRGENILLMSGFGGIGKTALARLVFHTVRENYDQVAWIPYRKNLKNSMLGSIQGLKGNNPEERWDEIQHILNNGASKLIVIDNADRDEKADQSPEDDALLQSIIGYPNTTVLLTSRLEEIYDYAYYEVGFLSPNACVELFYKHYENDPDRVQETAVQALAELAKYHTLTIELIAKGARRETNLRAYYAKLQKSFANAKLKVRTGHNDKHATIVEHLKVLFDISGRTDEEKAALWDFAVLPAGAALTPEETELWFQHDPNLLDQLQQDGWMMWIDGRYAMHPLVKEILHLDPIPENTAEKFLAFVENTNNGYFPYNDVHIERDRKLALAESVVAAVCRKDTLQLGYILANIGIAYWQAGHYPQAEAHYIRVIEITETNLGKAHPDTAIVYNNIAEIYRTMGNFDKAQRFNEKAKSIREDRLGKEHSDTATTYNNTANIHLLTGDHDKALEHYKKALAILEADPGENRTNIATTYDNIARVYQNMGELDKALEVSKQAQTIYETELGEWHPDTATAYDNIACIYFEKGEINKAIEFSKKAQTIYETELGEWHPDTATTYNNIALVYKAKGDLDKSLKFFVKAMAIHEAKLGKDHPDTATTYHNMGVLYYAKKDYKTATDFLLRALRIFLRKLDPGHPNTQDTQRGLSLCRENEGNAPKTFFPWLMGQLDEEERKLFLAHLRKKRK